MWQQKTWAPEVKGEGERQPRKGRASGKSREEKMGGAVNRLMQGKYG